MKTLMETLNETLENSLQLEIAKLVDNQSEEKQEIPESVFQKKSEQIKKDRYEQALRCGLFEGTYYEYKKHIKLGPIGYVQKI